MLENNLALQSEILKRYEQLEAAGAFSEVQFLNQQNIVAETNGRLMQSKAERLRQIALLDQQTAQLKSELADLNGRLVETKVTLRYQQLKSPVDGVVFDLKPTSRGFTAQSTHGHEGGADGFARSEGGGAEQQDRFRAGAARMS